MNDLWRGVGVDWAEKKMYNAFTSGKSITEENPFCPNVNHI